VLALVERNFVAPRRNQPWVADITFVPAASPPWSGMLGAAGSSAGPWRTIFRAARPREEEGSALIWCDKTSTEPSNWGGVMPFKVQVGPPQISIHHGQTVLITDPDAQIEWPKRHDIVVLEGVAAHVDRARKEKRLIHAVGDGTFVVDGRHFDRKEAMRSKLPSGV
jgi:hypothetical protein